MFCEKFICLNKSTTKFAIIGFHPVRFVPIITICNRESGDNFSLTSRQYSKFIRKLQIRDRRIINDKKNEFSFIYNDDDSEHDMDMRLDRYNNDTWKISVNEGNKNSSMVLHNFTVNKLVDIDICIRAELEVRKKKSLEYPRYIDELRLNTINMNEKEIINYLIDIHTTPALSDPGTLQQQIALDLIYHREFFLTLREYDDGFYRRNV